jgi:RNA polymerase sigma-70 factor (ECF subfamily)
MRLSPVERPRGPFLLLAYRMIRRRFGNVPAARRAIRGADKIARFFLGVQRRFPPVAPEVRLKSLNGRPGVVVLSGGRPDTAFTFEWSGERVSAIYAVRNPEKLRHLSRAQGPPAS